MIPTGYVAQGAAPLSFNLTNRNITEVLPDAFIARGEHQRVRSVSLRGNHLTELPEGLFRDLLQQYGYGSPTIHTLDLADNRIATLPRTLFQAGSSGESTVIRDSTICTYKAMTCPNCMQGPFMGSPLVTTAS